MIIVKLCPMFTFRTFWHVIPCHIFSEERNSVPRLNEWTTSMPAMSVMLSRNMIYSCLNPKPNTLVRSEYLMLQKWL